MQHQKSPWPLTTKHSLSPPHPWTPASWLSSWLPPFGADVCPTQAHGPEKGGGAQTLTGTHCKKCLSSRNWDKKTKNKELDQVKKNKGKCGELTWARSCELSLRRRMVPTQVAGGCQQQHLMALLLWATSFLWPSDWGDLEWLVPIAPPSTRPWDCAVSTSQHWFLAHCRQHLGLQGPSLSPSIPPSPNQLPVPTPAGMPCLYHLPSLYLHCLLLCLHPQTICNFNTARFRLRPWVFSPHTPQGIQGHP